MKKLKAPSIASSHALFVTLAVFLILILIIWIVIHLAGQARQETFAENNPLPTFIGTANMIGGTWKTNGCQLQSFRLLDNESLVQAKCVGIKGFPEIDMNTCATAALDFDTKTKQLKCTVKKVTTPSILDTPPSTSS